MSRANLFAALRVLALLVVAGLAGWSGSHLGPQPRTTAHETAVPHRFGATAPTFTQLPVVYMPPAGGTADSSARICAALNANAGKATVAFTAGTYYWNTTCSYVPGVSFLGNPLASVVLGLTERGSPASPYNAMFGVDNQTTPLATTTLAVAAPPGQEWILATGTLATDGKALALWNGVLVQENTTGLTHQSATYWVVGGYAKGTVAIVGGLFGSGGTLNGTTLSLTVGGTAYPTTFSAPANIAAVMSQINAVTGSAVTASYDINAFLVLSSSVGPITINAGTANGVLGVTAGLAIAIDRPILYAGLTQAGFPVGAQVSKYTRIHDATLDFNGTTVSGTFERVASCAGCTNVNVRNVKVIGAGNEYTFSSDTGGFQNSFDNITCADGNTVCVAVEGTESARVQRVTCTNSTQSLGQNACMFTQAARNVLIEDLESNGRIGLSGACIVIGDTTDQYGSEDVSVMRARCNSNLIGVQITGGSKRVSLRDVSVERSSQYGLIIQAQTTPTRTPGDLLIDRGWFAYNGYSGVYADGAPRVKITNSRFLENGASTSNPYGAVQIVNGATVSILSSDMQEGMGSAGSGLSASSAVYSQSSTDNLTVDSCSIASLYNSTFYAIRTNGVARVTNTRFSLTAGNAMCILQANGTLETSGNEALANVDYGGYQTSGTLRRLTNDFTNCAAPWTISGGGANFGTLTSNGVAQVATTGVFPATSTVSFSLSSAGTTPCASLPYLSAAQTSGNLYTKNATVSCNSVFNWIELSVGDRGPKDAWPLALALVGLAGWASRRRPDNDVDASADELDEAA